MNFWRYRATPFAFKRMPENLSRKTCGRSYVMLPEFAKQR